MLFYRRLKIWKQHICILKSTPNQYWEQIVYLKTISQESLLEYHSEYLCHSIEDTAWVNPRYGGYLRNNLNKSTHMHYVHLNIKTIFLICFSVLKYYSCSTLITCIISYSNIINVNILEGCPKQIWGEYKECCHWFSPTCSWIRSSGTKKSQPLFYTTPPVLKLTAMRLQRSSQDHTHTEKSVCCVWVYVCIVLCIGLLYPLSKILNYWSKVSRSCWFHNQK